MDPKLQWNPIACDGRGLCAELLAERIALDDWGYPIVSDQPVPAGLIRDARAAIAACPTFALKLG
jgi:ferredoxin